MQETGSRPERRNRIIRRAAIALSTVALVGCGSSEYDDDLAYSQKTTGNNEPTLTFDHLGGGSAVIMVYPGVTTSASDRQFNGTFFSGDAVPAECKTDGRVVHSDPSVGEENRTSDQWVRITGSPGETQYATAVYVKNPQALLEQLKICERP